MQCTEQCESYLSRCLPEETKTEEITVYEEVYKISDDGVTWKTIRKVTTVTPQGTSETTEVLKGRHVNPASGVSTLCTLFT